MTAVGGMKNFDIIANTVGFDGDWYTATYPDAAALGLDGEAHFRRIGYRIGRGVSAAIPRLADNPGLNAALQRQPRISYCTPVMNRPDDIRTTLRSNLDENRPVAEDLEFVMVFMDEDTETHDWVRSEFAEDLASGYLRLIVEPPLDGWHFGVAKNRHRNYAVGAIYSSLDGDNFITLDETQQLLEVARAQNDWFIFHHFTGSWGDGSSGRVSLPMSVYREIGYDEAFMPRQYDEMDVMLSAMCTWPDLPLVRIRSDRHGFSGRRSSAFWEEAGVSNPVIELDPPERRSPINPKGADYVQQDIAMEAMTSFNQGLCFLRNAPTAALRDKYLKLAIDGRHRVIDALEPGRVLSTLFRPSDNPAPEDLEIGPQDVCVFACMKNDEGFLQAFYDHYKALDVARFFIVDDGSDTPIETLLPHGDVHVFRPKVGNFVTAKGMWLEGLMKAYLAPGQWALTLDADEFMDLPVPFDSFSALVAQLEADRRDYAPALLIDMVPGAPLENDDADDFLQSFDHYVFAEDRDMGVEYTNTASIRWAFGPYKRLSWLLDARYHAFGTLDSLRKIPLFRTRPGRHINQGFHTLHYTDGTSAPGHEIWDIPLVLPIRHFKLVKLFSETARAQMAAHVADAASSPYHSRTTENIARIFAAGDGPQVDAILALPSRSYDDNLLRNLDPRSFHDAEEVV